MAKARWCFSPVRPALANRGSRLRFWNALPASRTPACAISVLRSTPTARSIPSSARWNVPPDLRTTTRRKRGSTSSMHCSRRLRHQPRTAALFAEMLSLANDGRYPVVELTPQQRRQRTLEALTAQMKALTRASPVLMIFEDAHWIDPTSSGSARSGGGPDSDHACAADRDVSAGIRSALDRPALRDRPHHQSAGSARQRRHDRPPCRQQGPAGETSGKISSSAPTAFPCLWRK